ncbi:hypothetical protein D3C76_897420 [compost metagenome]
MMIEFIACAVVSIRTIYYGVFEVAFVQLCNSPLLRCVETVNEGLKLFISICCSIHPQLCCQI